MESSDSELNIDIGSDEEETEEQIIERRRQEREQLLKVPLIYHCAVCSEINPDLLKVNLLSKEREWWIRLVHVSGTYIGFTGVFEEKKWLRQFSGVI